MSIDVFVPITHDAFRLDARITTPAKGITALIGPSGCGKTSLLRAIAGLDKVAGAQVSFNDTTWQDEHQFVPPHLRRIGYVFQEASLFDHLTCRENIDYAKRYAQAQGNTQIEQIQALDVSVFDQRYPGTLSGGERQRVAIARALASQPQLLLMDEPLAGLDGEQKEQILPYLESLSQTIGIPILYVTHALEEVARFSHYTAIVGSKKISAYGETHDILTRLDLPLSHSSDAVSVIDAIVTTYDDTDHISYLSFGAGELAAPGVRLTVNAQVRVRIAARDVSLTLEHQQHTSILNILPAVVTEISEDNASQCTVLLSVGGTRLLARVTGKSVSALQLSPGREVFAQVKSVAIV